MFIVDDPLLALIVRFVATDRRLDGTDNGFLNRQVETMKQYLTRFPEVEQGDKAIEWVAEYAAQYRAQWQKKVISRRVGQMRCVDCPMNMNGTNSYCQIHFQWMELLQRYADNGMSSIEYVEQALEMLNQHKAELKVRKLQEAEELDQLKILRDSRNKPL